MARSDSAVVLVHGIWMSGLDLLPLSWRLGREGWTARIFRYPSLRTKPAANAEALLSFVQALEAPTVHLVGHSLGGLVILHALASKAALPPGRVVLLGSPVRGSAVARLLAARRPLGRLFLGQSLEEGLLGDAPRDLGGREVMTIAGSAPVGIGRVLADLEPPHDGTVSVAETRLEGAAASLVFPVTHTGLLVAKPVAEAVATFLGGG